MHNMTQINQFIAHPGSTFNDATNATVIIGKDVTVSPSSTSNNKPNAGISDCATYLAPGRDKIDLIRIINAIAEMNPPFFINSTVLGLAQKDIENNIYPTSEGYVLRNGKRKYL